MKKQYLLVDIGQKVFVVVKAKRLGDDKNIVFKAEVVEAVINNKGIKYICSLEKCVNDKTLIMEGKTLFGFKNANIDTGYGGENNNQCQVFTTKEGCLEWLRN